MIQMKDAISWRDYLACIEAHHEYHGAQPHKTRKMSKAELEALDLGQNVIVTDFKGGKNAS